MASSDALGGMRVGRVRTPAVLQMESVECGAACLAIVLGYYGRIVALAQLRRDCGVSRDGARASNVIRAALAYGLDAKGFRKEVEQLGNLAYPFIVFWNFDHFVVVEGRHGDRVYLNDPATGPRQVSATEFDEAYTGVVLAMAPGANFKRGGRKPSTLAGLWRRLRGSTGEVALCALVALLMVIPGLAIPALTQVFVDKALVEGLREWARPIVLGVLAATALRLGLDVVQAGILRRLKLRLAIGNSSRFVWHLLGLPASYYSQRFSGEIAGRIPLNDRVAEVLSGRLAATLIDVLMMAFYAFAMLQFDRLLTLVGIGAALVDFVVLRWVAARRVDANRRLGYYAGKTAGVSISGLQGIRTIKAGALEQEFFERWAGHYATQANAHVELGMSNQAMSLLPPLLTSLATVLVLTVGGWRVLAGAMTAGQLVAFYALMLAFLRPVNGLISLGTLIQDLESDLSRLDDVLDSPSQPPAMEEAAFRGDPRLRGEVELRNVTFGYNPLAPPLIENLSFRAEPGRRVALVGASGSGKSTVAKILAGLYAPTSGEVLFDGEERSRYPSRVLAHSVALVEQDVLVFSGSIRDNLTLWDASASQEVVEAACRDAMIHDVVSAFPGGYDGGLLEGAANLSGGQRQRLEIARALACEPAVLILDEATSALDAGTERQIDENLRRRGCTCIIVAHRLSTIRDCDEIIVMDQGKVVQRGRHEDLIREAGAYARLVGESAERAA